MIYSMTAYATRMLATPLGVVHWEIRSINHRYLDLSFKLPDTLRALEWDCKEWVRQFISRGKVECFLKFEPSIAAEQALRVNFLRADRIIDACSKLNERLSNPSPISPLEILQIPSVLEPIEIKLSAVRLPILNGLETTLQDLMENRAREGKSIQQLLENRLLNMKTALQDLSHRLPDVQKLYREKLRVKLADLKMQIDEPRFEQELIYWLQKSDISEELDRLSLHLTEVERILAQGGVLGRRLDFLMQELNREANTLASKALDTETVNTAIQCKVLIEELREQIQNLE